MKIAIIGSGDLAQQIAYYAETDQNIEIVGYFDDYLKKGKIINGRLILGGIFDIHKMYTDNVFEKLIIGIGYKHFDFREEVFDTFKEDIPFANLIHSTSYIDPSVELGEGVVVFPGNIIDKSVTIKNNVLINISCTIAHDSSIGSHSFLSPSVKIAGFVKIGKKCNIGINTTIIDNVTICDAVQTGGGTVVIKSIEKSGLYVGNPQRFIR